MKKKENSGSRRKKSSGTRSFGKTLMILSIVFFYLPILYMMLFSFNEGKSLTTFTGFSLRWYQHMLDSRDMMEALYTTFGVALIATAVSTVVGTIAAIGLSKSRKVVREVMEQVNNLPLMNPDIVTAIGFMLLFITFKVEKGYFLNSDMVDLDTAKFIIDGLNVQTVSVVTNTVEIPFETKNVRDSKKERGYSAVTTKGENGITEKTEKIVKVNGETIESTVLESKVIKEQVTQVVTIGTANAYISATTKANIQSAGFICPISAGKYRVSSYYGDGRNHKAIDLAADRGTPIFAAGAGKVIYSGWDGDYGYSVVIEHANGMKTRYAHANALCVTKGATVAQGDMIATVGSTGWSTGNHLHFEVIVNGVKVNPGPYIGLR